MGEWRYTRTTEWHSVGVVEIDGDTRVLQQLYERNSSGAMQSCDEHRFISIEKVMSES